MVKYQKRKIDMTEMARETGINSKNSFSGKSDWEYYKENKRFIKLFKDKVTSKNYKIYTTKNSFFLISLDNAYLGKIQFYKDAKNIHIESSHSIINGFYEIMFTFILSEYDSITSDMSLSTQAIKSYEKLSKKSQNFDVKVLTYDNIKVPFTKKTLLSHQYNKVLIESEIAVEHIKTYYRRISMEENGLPSSFKRMFLEGNRDLDRYLFCDILENL